MIRVSDVIDIQALAGKIAAEPEAIRLAGQGLFEALSSGDPDLAKALIEASASSGLAPEAVLQILATLAADFRQPRGQTTQEHGPSLVRRVETIANAASGSAVAAVDKAREAIASIDLAGAKALGAKVAAHIRDEIEAVDGHDIRNRAGSVGRLIAEKARSLAGGSPSDDKPASAAPKKEKF